jgi:hypothetical protein
MKSYGNPVHPHPETFHCASEALERDPSLL